MYVNTAPAGLVASTDAFAGTVIAGAVLSRTVTNVADTDDNCPSLTVNVSMCEPIGNIAVTVAAFPISVARSVHRKDSVSPSRSVPLPVSATLAPAADVASTVCGAPALAVGA